MGGDVESVPTFCGEGALAMVEFGEKGVEKGRVCGGGEDLEKSG